MDLSYYIIFFVCSLLSLYLIQQISIKFNFYDFPSKEKVHKEKVTKSAGLAMIPVIILNFAFITYNFHIFYFLIFLIGLIILGFIDDVVNFSPSKKLFTLSLLLFFFALEILKIDSLGFLFNKNLDLSFFSLPFSVLCFLLLINSFNYFDGLDGLLGSLSLISLIYFLYFSNGQLFFFLISIVIYLIVFLFFNFGILPKQFMGDSGSLGLGFIVSFLATYTSQIEMTIKPSFIIWPLALFVYEFLTINLIRIKLKKNIFLKDLNFVFNIFAFKYGQFNAVVICILIQLFFCLNGIILENFKLDELSIILFCLYFIFYLILRFKQFNKYAKKDK